MEQANVFLARLTEAQKTSLVLYHKRLKVCRQYFLLLVRMLYYASEKLSNDAVFEGQKKYIAILLCTAYFRLPQFRTALLKSLLNAEERAEDIPEWRGTEFDLTDPALKQSEEWVKGSELKIVLDWNSFHTVLQGYFGEASLKRAVSGLSRNKGEELWKDRLCRRGGAFFSFLENWTKHVYQLVPHKASLKWYTVPGYPTLLKGLLLEMRARDVTKYPDSLLNCSGAMLANEKLLSVFAKILFLKTSIYNTPAVFSAMNYTDYWMQVLSLREQPLPSNFDFSFMLRGFDIILGCDICLNMAKGLWLLYKNLGIFSSSRLRSVVTHLLLNKYFHFLFLHWSWLVRKCFMWIMLYKIADSARRAEARASSHTAAGIAKLPADDQVMIEGFARLSQLLESVEAPPIFIHTNLLKMQGLIASTTGEGGATARETPTATHSPGLLPGLSGALPPLTRDESSRAVPEAPPASASGSNKNFYPSSLAPSPLTSVPDPSISSSGFMKPTKIAAGAALGPGGDPTSNSPDPSSTQPSFDIHSTLTQDRQRIGESRKVYLPIALSEFRAELFAYRQWIMQGTTTVPVMHIPSSPLDQNVDVPLENW